MLSWRCLKKVEEEVTFKEKLLLYAKTITKKILILIKIYSGSKKDDICI